ncbi:MAG: sulfurtransferase complex subunit TusC [Pseudomonadales bacterium]|jgi:tRNA 2-thiouridine synthesizing protein C|nr:sulfurtransferase complex subunit TusC [Pseudomonadales bacterium]MCC6530899.1 sulfurtransferase complex subunit TusC [Pseudomonadales bacterium]HMU90222.1 sulfurtransferase complex subunit TusC [Pseudomonadales bacterium]HMW15349.1 sulfurtransferase complex subunit TusC [Pseudomonadales bacterium]HMW82262.1 sulfurtransferase complex subunit TusC [Pseudomonadales bacterium]
MKLAIVQTRPPHQQASGREGLDTALVGAVFDLEVSLLFVDDGVYQLLAGQDPAAIGQKPWCAAFEAAELYGIRQLLVDAEALAERGIEVGELMVPVELRSGSELAQHLDSCDQVLVF